MATVLRSITLGEIVCYFYFESLFYANLSPFWVNHQHCRLQGRGNGVFTLLTHCKWKTSSQYFSALIHMFWQHCCTSTVWYIWPPSKQKCTLERHNTELVQRSMYVPLIPFTSFMCYTESHIHSLVTKPNDVTC